MSGLHPYDTAVIIGYLVIIALIGLYAARIVKDTGQYFLGNRRFGKWLMIGQSFGVGTQADQPVGTAGKSYQWGFSGLWFGWKFLFCTPVYWLMAPVFRRLRVVTSAEYMEMRYGRGVGLLYGFYAVLFLMINLSAMQNGAAKVVSEATGGAMSHAAVVWSMTLIFMLYGYHGGRVSAVITDFVQSFLIIILSVILVPFGLWKLGGYRELQAILSSEQLSLKVPGGLTLGLIAVLSIQSMFSAMPQPQHMASVGTGRSELSCRVGYTYGNMLKRFCTLGWTLVGVIVIAMVARNMVAPLGDPEAAFGVACRALLGPGFLGLMVASVLATNMSTCSAMMVDLGALFVQNVHRPFIRPAASDGHYLTIGRVAGIALVFASMGMIKVMPNVLDALLQSDSLAAFMGVPFVAGLFWRRANRLGAALAFTVGFGTNIALGLYRHGNVMEWHADLFMVSLAAGIAALVIGSLLGRPEPGQTWDALQERLHTPASVESLPPDQIRKAAREAEANGESLLLVDLFQLHRTFSFRRYRTDLVGFAWAFATIGFLIGCAALLVYA